MQRGVSDTNEMEDENYDLVGNDWFAFQIQDRLIAKKQ